MRVSWRGAASPGLRSDEGATREGDAMQAPRKRADDTTIELRNVSRWYGNVVAVNDVTMSIGPGVTGLLGPNGAGKSTIMHMIAGFLPPSRGELTIGSEASWRDQS